jgi:hypothetical protein
MTKMKGKVGWSDLEGGYPILEGEDGQTYKLEGDTKALPRGKQVEITGNIETMMGIGFDTPVLTVKGHKLL